MPVLCATKGVHLTLVKQLLEMGPCIDSYEVALSWAAEHGENDPLRYLKET